MGKSLIKIWKERERILEGIKYALFKNEHVEEVAAERNEICQSCEFIDREGKKCFLKGSQPCCGVCGCSLQFLQRSLSSKCEMGRWPAILTEEEDDALNDYLNSNKNGTDI
jgi:hypothetical protein